MTTTLIILAVLIAAFFIRITIENNRVPKLGVTDGKLAPISKKPNNVSTQTDVPQKKVATWAFKDSPEATMAAIKKAVEQFGGATVKEESDDYLYVIFTTALMKYRDDAEFYLDKNEGVVHFRSCSRAGYSDMGLNRTRYNELSELYRMA